MIRNAPLFLSILLLLPLLTACGGDEITHVESETHTTTIGEELLDLQRAHERGIISKREYNRAKDDIIRRYER